MFTVEWTDASLTHIARMLLIANKYMRSEITKAVQEIGQSLQDGADEFGESRSAGNRIAFVGPLAVQFRVNVRLKLAIVARLWPIWWYM